MAMPGFTLARWFTTPRVVNRPEDESVREEVLNDIAQATSHGVHDRIIVVRTPRGVAVLELSTINGAHVVFVDYVQDDTPGRLEFWMNASSLGPIYQRVLAQPCVPFDQIFCRGQ
jgi:hypothetical protein